MNLEKVLFGFFVLLALTLNFGFVMGDIDNPDHHHAYELFAAIVVSLVATILKLGDRSHIGATLLATSLVADLQLVVAACIWGWMTQIADTGMTPGGMASIVSMAGGAMVANLASAVVLIIETVNIRR